MCIFASALYIKLGKQLILLYFKTMQNSELEDLKSIRQPSILSLLFTPPLLPENKVRFGVCIQRLDSLFFC